MFPLFQGFAYRFQKTVDYGGGIGLGNTRTLGDLPHDISLGQNYTSLAFLVLAPINRPKPLLRIVLRIGCGRPFVNPLGTWRPENENFLQTEEIDFGFEVNLDEQGIFLRGLDFCYAANDNAGGEAAAQA